MTDRLVEAVAGARNVLVLATGPGAARDAVCASLLGDEPRVLSVALRTTAGDWIDSHEVDRVHVVETGESTVEQSTVVESPADLTGLGVAVGDPVDRMDEEGVVCVDSLTTLLDHVAPERAYRFIHALTTRVNERGATAHYHADAEAHEPMELARLATLFDAMVGVDVSLPAAPDESLTVEKTEVGVLRRPGVGEGND